jgi:ABC-2 type transport system ATP-binding protein
MNPTIETNHLSKQYGDVTAVDNLSLRVAQGEIYAFLGLNGAGKTTTIRMLLGLVKPTAGEAIVLGTRIQAGRRQPWSSVGYLMETPRAYPELTVRENIEVMRRLRPGTPPQAVDQAIDLLGLAPYAGRRSGTLSLGNAQRLGLAKALLHQPRLLLLDEPANGLDPAGIVEIRKLLRRLAREQGVTIFISSHILGEVARLADRIGIIHQGRLLQELNISDLQQQRQRRLLVGARDRQAAQSVLAQAGYAPQINGQDHLALHEEAAVTHPDTVAAQLTKAGHPPTMLLVEHEDLEHYFLRLVDLVGEQEK